jgi:L-alanine-DL-glutamate epimerase-like enolase superfamily enzyme
MKMEIWRYDLGLTHTWTIASSVARGGNTVSPSVFVSLSSKDVSSAIGEAATAIRYQETGDTIEAFLRKVDPNRLSFDDIAGSMAYLDTIAPGNSSAKGAINIALLDGAARKAGLPLYDYFRLGFREGAHTTSFTIGIDTPEKIRQKVLEAESYPILKLKVGGPNDRENIAALRAVAPKKRVRIDGNEGWKTPEEALRNIEWFAKDPNIEFIEQPMPATTQAKDWQWLKARSPMPIMADENCISMKDLQFVVDNFHYANVKLCKTAGPSQAIELLTALRKAGLKTMLGCMIESSVLTAAAAHLAELTDFLDIDGNILITNDPFVGPTSKSGMMSFANSPNWLGLCVAERKEQLMETN